MRAAAVPGRSTLTFVADPSADVRLRAPAVASRQRRASVTPAVSLTDGQSVTVAWTGYTPGVSVNIVECSVSRPSSAGDCDLTSAKVLQPDPGGTGHLAFTVHTGRIGHRVCDAAHPGCVVAVNEGGSLAPGSTASIRISFAPTG